MKERSNQFIEALDSTYEKIKSGIMKTKDTDEDMMEKPEKPLKPLKPCKPCGQMANDDLASCNIVSQPYSEPMEEENCLVCGTVFADLVMPYEAGWHLYPMTEEGDDE